MDTLNLGDAPEEGVLMGRPSKCSQDFREQAVWLVRAMSNGLTREFDIDLGNLLVQVKGGNARSLTGQIVRTEASTGTPTIGYAPDISDAAWGSAARQGIAILQSQSELLAYIREFG